MKLYPALGFLLLLLWMLTSLFSTSWSLPVLFLGILTLLNLYHWKEKRRFLLLCNILAVLLSVMILTLAWQSDSADSLGIDYQSGSLNYHSDSHGGFLGDGESLEVYQFPDNSLEKEITENPDWYPLPNDTITKILWGMETEEGQSGPYLVNIHLPQIQQGYYFFLDRHPESTDPHDLSPVLERYSFNFTLALYDQSKQKLYLIKLDT